MDPEQAFRRAAAAEAPCETLDRDTGVIYALDRDFRIVYCNRAWDEFAIAQANAAIGESRMRMLTLRQQYFQDLVTDLRDTQLKLSNIVPQMTAANTEFDRVQVRAPVTGKVLGLTAHTVDGVIAPGDKILSVVPDKAPLVIDAYILPQDGDDVRPGLATRIRFSGLYRHDLPDMKGKILDVSGDSFTDPKTGQSFFKAKIEVSPESTEPVRYLRNYRALFLALQNAL